jgi:hypothetical protein
MDVFIKSFNRPYYLERCLRSLQSNLQGDFNITVLDDGTPLKYLEKIKAQLPSIKILRSNFAALKEEAISKHLKEEENFSLKKIPSQFWLENISKGSDIFLLMEEDAWMTGKLTLQETLEQIRKNNIVSLKLFWCENDHIVKGKKTSLSDDLEVITPSVLSNSTLANLLLNRKLRIRSAISRSANLTKELILPYYALYTVSSAFFDKKFWTSLWKDSSDVVNEDQQLLKALKWYRSHPESRYAKSKIEKISTSYLTASYNTFQKIDFDFIRFNHVLNEAWISGDLDASQNLPGDFEVRYLEKFIGDTKTKDLNADNWRRWITTFQTQFREQGCKIDSF